MLLLVFQGIWHQYNGKPANGEDGVLRRYQRKWYVCSLCKISAALQSRNSLASLELGVADLVYCRPLHLVIWYC